MKPGSTAVVVGDGAVGLGAVIVAKEMGAERIIAMSRHESRQNLAAKGPADWFTGDVYIDPVAASPAPSRVSAALVHFMPGARTHWHRHPLGQTVFVTEGAGLCQRRGGPVEVIRPGDRVLFEADEEHWHGAAPNRLMVHLAINEADTDHDVVHWMTPVTDEEYNMASATA